MSAVWTYSAVAMLSAAAAVLWPLSPAVAGHDDTQARIASAVLSATVSASAAALRMVPRNLWIGVAMGAALIGAFLVLVQFDASADCVAQYNGRAVIIGRQYSAEGQAYVAANPGLSPSDLLFDAAGAPERLWTAPSIRWCRVLVSWSGPAALPLFALAACAALSATRHRFLPAARPPSPPPFRASAASLYDVFVSYRHCDVDREYASSIVEFLEGRGLRAAIDVRDFAPNEHFLSEMERCIRQSRFVLCVITSQYLASDHTSEEAIISKTLDMAEQRKRLVPLIFERVELPVWLHGLVGVDFTPSTPIEPFERLLALVTSDRPHAG